MKNGASRFAALAALGLLGSACTENDAAPSGAKPATTTEHKSDKECCMGKNSCKGKGGCAVPESHACAGKNDCASKGGCNMHCPK